MAEPFQSAVFLAFICLAVQHAVQGKYVEQKMCSQESCLYSYTADQVSSVSGSQSTLYIASTVEVACESTGTYETQAATKYCMKLKDTSIATEDNSLKVASGEVDELLSGPFCFVQGEDGKVLSVYYNPSEKSQIVNYKKGLAAAFQANFKNTVVEVEQDTQSKHYSHYTYEEIAPNHVIMHRKVDSESVIQFAASEQNGRSMSVERAEDIEYKGGRLLNSAGTAVVIMSGPVKSQDLSHFQSEEDLTLESNPETYDATFGSGGVSGTGKYSLQLLRCAKKKASLKRSAQSENTLTEGSLVPQFDKEERDYEEMDKLRQSLPSIRNALIGLHKNINDTATSNRVKKLLVLESEHGPLPGYQPAVSEVMDYLSVLSSLTDEDFEMRALLYSFLAADGTYHSQEILLRAIKTTSERKEKNSVTVQLAFIRKIHPDILVQIENLILSSNDSTNPLILSYGALASSSTPELQRHIVQFLLDLTDAKVDRDTLIHLVHALGNTESMLANKKVLQLMAHDDHDIRVAAVYALRYSMESNDVQNAVVVALHNNPDSDFAEMVLRAMIAGSESSQLSTTQPIGDSLFEATLLRTKNNPVLRSMLFKYVKTLGPKAPTKWMEMLSEMHHKRDTTIWNTNDALFNLVEDLNTRKQDLTTYPYNRAYLWSKSLGVSAIKLDIAFGAFAGFGGSANPNLFKLYAKGIAQGYAFGYTKTVFEALISSVNPPGGSSISNRLYVSIVGKVLVNYSKQIPTCKSWNYPLYASPNYQLLKFSHKIFIYVGFLEFSVSLNARLNVGASLTACVTKCVSAKVNIVPKVTVTASASATASLIEIVRGGIDISGSFEYNATPQLTGSYLLFKGPFEFCLTLTHGWPNNVVSIYAYYQTRSIDWCKGWLGIKYPCGFSWGSKNKWEAASKDWHLSSYGPYTLWRSCDPAKLQCPAIAKS